MPALLYTSLWCFGSSLSHLFQFLFTLPWSIFGDLTFPCSLQLYYVARPILGVKGCKWIVSHAIQYNFSIDVNCPSILPSLVSLHPTAPSHLVFLWEQALYWALNPRKLMEGCLKTVRGNEVCQWCKTMQSFGDVCILIVTLDKNYFFTKVYY